jgi:decaprenylphospho-beta-D-ribofuranose 2-oxidase
MRSKKILFSNFSRALFSQSSCIRPDNEQDLIDYRAYHEQQSILVRGSGLSYNDSCFNTNGFIIDSSRFNHFIHFDETTGILECQGALTFRELFLVHPEFIPPVIPGTVHATVAGGLAHDVHGKNNHRVGSFGQHIIWLDLLLGTQKIHCSREENSELFHATIAGLGLTGIILRMAIRLQKNTRFVIAKRKQFTDLDSLVESMATYGLEHDYQVAWLDLLKTKPRAILSVTNHCEPFSYKEYKTHTLPKFPFGCLKSWNMKLFNSFFFHYQKTEERLELQQFNNPLDKLMHWNRLYGPKGLIQFQAVFDQEQTIGTLNQLVQLIRKNKATPILAVLKLFTQKGEGLLSFCKPGFTLAIDFAYNKQALQAIEAMNQLITEINGHIYLAKDLVLNENQYKKIYKRHEEFSQVLTHYGCNMHSDLAKRLGILK